MTDDLELLRASLRRHADELNLSEAGVAQANIVSLGNGENNLMYKISVEDRDLVIRASFRSELETSLVREYELLSVLPEGIGPRPLVLDVTKQDLPRAFMVQSLVPGSHMATWTEELLEAHANKMTLLHGSQQESCDGIDIVALFAEKIDFRKDDPGIFSADIQDAVDKITQYVSLNAEAFSGLRSLRRIHGDLHGGNILAAANDVMYVDWEESRMGDPAVDVAGILLSSQLAPNVLRHYVGTYESLSDSRDIGPRIITWLLYKKLSFLLHKKWESLDPSRSIHGAESDPAHDIVKTIQDIEDLTSR